MVEFKHLQEALAQYAQAITDRYKQNLESSGRRASGELISSVNSNVTVNGNEYAIELNLEDYWKWIDEGRPPTHTTTPSEPTLQECILEWIKLKHILPHPDKNGKLPTEEQLSYAIANKIHKEGYEGTYDLEHTMDELGDKWDDIIVEALDADIFNNIDEILKFVI